MYYAYILRSYVDDSHYIGVTSDLLSRLKEHNNGEGGYSSRKAPYLVEWYAAFQDKGRAYAFERYLKSSSGFAFRKKHLI